MMGEKLRLARKKAKMSQEEVAEKLNIARSNISKYEHDKLEPNIHTIKQFCEISGVTADYLLGIEEEKQVIHNNNISIGNIEHSPHSNINIVNGDNNGK
ncbi:MAG: helix-turn-helix domain-containing protein [Ruminococcus sp.]|nr:helix-turn-helix domain-containing protein [Ruminococcus sp.]